MVEIPSSPRTQPQSEIGQSRPASSTSVTKAPSITQSQIETSSAIDVPVPSAYKKDEYESLAQQFSIFVVVSTFTAALIVAILSFTHDAIDPEHNTRATVLQFEAAMVILLSTIGLHIAIIIVSGRAATLCFRLASFKDTIRGDLEAALPQGTGRTLLVQERSDSAWDPITNYKSVYFDRYTRYCERTQFVGTCLLLVSVLILAFSLFQDLQFFWVLIGVSVTAISSVFWTGFWGVSVLGECVRRFWNWITSLTCSGSKKVT